MPENLIPTHEHGKELDIVFSKEEATAAFAVETFSRAQTKLLNPTTWNEHGAIVNAELRKTAEQSKDFSGNISLHDYIEINIPAPGLTHGDGHDWVQVHQLEKDFDEHADESIALTLIVSKAPDDKEESVAHFFKEGASSTFILRRLGSLVTASYHGRNETPNIDSKSLLDKIRNFIVATGAIAGGSKMHWEAFLKGLLEES